MESVSLDLLVLIARDIRLRDLFNFFLVSRKLSQVAKRDDLWRTLCRGLYGPWTLEDFPGTSWREITKLITVCRGDLKKRKMTSFAREALESFYIRSEERITVFVEDVCRVRGEKLGDVVANMKHKTNRFVSHNGLSDFPPRENCWPNKPARYSRFNQAIYIDLHAEIVEEACKTAMYMILRDPKGCAENLCIWPGGYDVLRSQRRQGLEVTVVLVYSQHEEGLLVQI